MRRLGPSGDTAIDALMFTGQTMVANAGPDRTVDCTSTGGTPVTLDGSGSVGPPSSTYRWSAPGVTFDDSTAAKPTGLFPMGVTKVVLRFMAGVAAVTDTAVVTVRDAVPPTLALTATPAVLWPPNHQLSEISVAVDARDNSDPSPAVRLLSVTSDEPDAELEAGDVPGDIADAEVGTDDRSFSVRAERAGGGPGRTYRACYEARDASGNATVECVTITVPHDQGRRAGPANDAMAGAAEPFAFAATVKPNPARAGAWFELTLPESGVARVTVFDVTGKIVARPIDGWRPAGRQREPLGSLAGAQVYWYRAEWQGRSIEGRFVTLR